MSFKSWTEKNQGTWEFIKFMVLSNISTITRIALTAAGTAIFVDALPTVLLLLAVAYLILRESGDDDLILILAALFFFGLAG